MNSLQKVVFESIEAHMEMCEKMNNESEKRCLKYIHYHTSIDNLTAPQEELYYSIVSLYIESSIQR